MGGITLAVQAWATAAGWHWQTMVFTVLAFLQLAHSLAVRSERESTFRLGFRSNMPLLVTVILTASTQLALIYVPAFQPIFETERWGSRAGPRRPRDADPSSPWRSRSGWFAGGSGVSSTRWDWQRDRRARHRATSRR
jgi:hypothetical protein